LFFAEQDSGDQKTRKGEKDVDAGPKVAEETYDLFRCVGVGLQPAGGPEVKEHDAQHSQAAQAVQGRNAIVILERQRIWRGWAAAGRAA
jgi:hypothetical protein